MEYCRNFGYNKRKYAGGRYNARGKQKKKKTDDFCSSCSDNGDVCADRMWR